MAGRKTVIDQIDLGLFFNLNLKLYRREISKKEMCEQLHISFPTFNKYYDELQYRSEIFVGVRQE